MKKKIIIALTVSAIILVGVVSVIIASEYNPFGKSWGKYLSENGYRDEDTSSLEIDDIYLVGKDVIIPKAEIEQAKYFYTISGASEDDALYLAIEYVEKYETMYFNAKKAGYKATEQELEDRINALKEMSEQIEDKEVFQAIIESFESEEEYWEYERSILVKDIAIEKYRETEIKPEFDKIVSHEPGSEGYWNEWAEWFNSYQNKITGDQEFVFATDLSVQEIEMAINRNK